MGLESGWSRIIWSCAGIGFGTLDFCQDNAGVLECDDEYMGRDFVKAVLNKIVDQTKFSSDS